jgi:hypothetical protein
MNNQTPLSKPTTPEQPTDEGLDETPCSHSSRVPRDLMVVLDQILEIIPLEEMEIRRSLNLHHSANRYRAPEVQDWHGVAATLQLHCEGREELWIEESLAVWRNDANEKAHPRAQLNEPMTDQQDISRHSENAAHQAAAKEKAERLALASLPRTHTESPTKYQNAKRHQQHSGQRLPGATCSPSFLCRLIGHHWTVKTVDEQSEPGYRITKREQVSHCRRCGMPNPIYFHSENA